jgi:hypothetical protein
MFDKIDEHELYEINGGGKTWNSVKKGWGNFWQGFGEGFVEGYWDVMHTWGY